MELVRLNKFIASNGFSSRRKIDEMILQGRVTVNDNTIVELGHKIEPERDKVKVDGENVRTSTKKIYIILNKPSGVITSVSDEKHRTTVIDLIKLKEKIFPVGRLDYNTTGLLLLTNDGELANKLMHPGSEIYKTYFVTLSKPLEEKHRLKLEAGVNLEQRKTAPCKIRFVKKNDFQSLYISIYEGRNRQVRNMFEHYGYFVRDLKRIEYAGMKLDSLRDGEWRKLTAEEVMRLTSIANKPPSAASKSPLVRSNNSYKKNGRREFKSIDRRKSKKYQKKDVQVVEKGDFDEDVKKKINRNNTKNFKKANVTHGKKDFKKDRKLNVKKSFKKYGVSDEKKDFRGNGKTGEKKKYKKDYVSDGKKNSKGNRKVNEKKNFKKRDI